METLNCFGGSLEANRGRKRPAEEDDLTIASTSRDQSRSPLPTPRCTELEIPLCLGSLSDIQVQIRSDPLPSVYRFEEQVALELLPKGANVWIKHAAGDPFGCLTTKVSQGLKRLRKAAYPCVEVQGIIALSKLEEARVSWKRTGRSAMSTIHVNVYGHPHCAKSVGHELTSVKLFLQPPVVDLRDLVYDNPQELKLTNAPSAQARVEHIDVTDRSPVDERKEVAQSEIEAILDHIPQPTALREVAVDNRIITTLIRHQKDAINFMSEREAGGLRSSLSFWHHKMSENGVV
ncbi:hypothetical protein CC80DRAFT_76368 [Byssothecium circinans]|uniref:Uncharacterized protein n=1 Tax=Byssothecium circinans TaxID=147558 RepID=A0A6A5TWI3_9PLEO|nr:hypothetical protein CC80DRAFT_76368 [Byssothecium circinans]